MNRAIEEYCLMLEHQTNWWNIKKNWFTLFSPVAREILEDLE